MNDLDQTIPSSATKEMTKNTLMNNAKLEMILPKEISLNQIKSLFPTEHRQEPLWRCR